MPPHTEQNVFTFEVTLIEKVDLCHRDSIPFSAKAGYYQTAGCLCNKALLNTMVTITSGKPKEMTKNSEQSRMRALFWEARDIDQNQERQEKWGRPVLDRIQNAIGLAFKFVDLAAAEAIPGFTADQQIAKLLGTTFEEIQELTTRHNQIDRETVLIPKWKVMAAAVGYGEVPVSATVIPFRREAEEHIPLQRVHGQNFEQEGRVPAAF